MKVAVTARSEGASAPIDPRFGRAAWFVIVDTESGEVHSIDNQAGVNAAQGAGTQAVQAIAAQGVQRLVTGDVGPKAFFALQAAGIEPFIGASGTVSSAVEALLEEKLQQASAPTRMGHGR